MDAITDLDLPSLDYSDPGLHGERFHDALRELRERTWIARAEPIGWFVLDRESVAFWLRTPGATFPGRTMLEVHGIDSGPLYERMKGNLLDLGGEDHRRLRKLIQPAFTPAAADRLRPSMRQRLEELWEPIAAAGECDFVTAFAKPFPARMIATVMGAPLEDAERLSGWANLIQEQFDPVALGTRLPEIERAAVEFQAYARGLLEDRKASPRDDLMSELIALEEEGDRLSEQECLDITSSVLVGGVDTTQAQLSHGIRLFAAHPEQWAALGEDPALAPAAVDEVLRFEPIAPFTARIALEDVEHRGVVFPKGTLVFACAESANRDPAQVAEPQRFDITAERGKAKPLTFGAGPHFCLGANLARAELQEAFAFLAPRMRDLAPAGEPAYANPLGIYALDALPVRWSSA